MRLWSSMQWRLTILVVMIVTAIVAIFGYVEWHAALGRQMAETEAAAELSAENLRRLLAAPLAAHDLEKANEVMEVTMRDPRVQAIFLMDKNGARLLVGCERLPGGEIGCMTQGLAPEVVAQGVSRSAMIHGERGGDLGSVTVVFSLERLRAVSQRILGFILARIVILDLILVVGLLTAMRRFFIRPVLDLAETVKGVAAGNLDRRAKERPDAGEIGELIANVNAMLDIMRQREDELRERRESLERAVAARTSELSTLNARLESAYTDMDDARRQAESAMRQALAANASKSEFLANMSHEIRTPLNAVLGMTELVLDTELDAQQREWVSIVRVSAGSLMELLNSVLDLSKIEAGRVELEEIPFTPGGMCRELATVYSGVESKNGRGLVVTVAKDVPALVLGDPLRLRQTLVNLISNAFKFSKTGDVTLSLRLADPAESKNAPGDAAALLFEVQDTGPGLPEGGVDKLFDPFTQADGSVTRLHGGTGLGLAISKRLVELMGGRIWAENRPASVGGGAVFRFTVRPKFLEDMGRDADQSAAETSTVETAARYPAAAPSEDAYPQRLLSGRALLVEDNEFNRQLALALLGEMGVEADSASNGQEALGMLLTRMYDVICMDVQMPVMDGLTTARKIRDRGLTIPILAMTAHALDGDREKCLEAGMDDYVSKPLDRALLRSKLARMLKRA